MLLEREAQLGTLRARLDLARSGTGSVVLVGGEAGAGKTSLIRAFVNDLPQSVEISEGACDPLATPRPLSPLHDQATAGDGPLAGLDISTDDRAALFHDVLDRLRRSGPGVMVIEDLHWADQATLDFVTHLARRVGSTSTVVVVTYRDDEIGIDHPARPVLGHVASLETSERVAVPALSLDAVAAIADGHHVEPGALHQATGGNAFFVTEVLASGSSLPANVQDAVLARLARLTDRERHAVQAVSIAPRSVPVETVIAAAGVDADTLDGAVGAGMLVDDRGRLRFRHELARAAVEQSMPPGRRRGLHATMLELLLDHTRHDHALLAHHAIRAGSAEAIVEHAPIAATDARSRGAVREAAAFAAAALDHVDLLGPERTAHLRLDLAKDLANLDAPTDSIEAARQAAHFFRTVGDASGESRALIQVGVGLGRIGRAAESETAFVGAVELLEPLGPSDELARALAQVASGAMLARRVGPGRAWAARADEVAELAGSADTQRAIRHVLACIEVVGGDPDVGLEMLTMSASESGDDPGRLATALVNLGSGAGEIRRYDVADQALRRGEQHCASHDFDDSGNYCRAWIARIEFEQGRWDAAVHRAEIVDRAAANRAGYALLTARGALGRVRVRRGDPDGASLLERALEQASGHNLQYVWPLVCGLAEAACLRGEADDARAVVEPWYRRALEADSAWARGELGFWLWRAGGLDGAPEGAALPFAHQIEGRWQAAADAWRSIGCPYEVALALADGTTDARLGAVAMFDELGAKPMADRVRSTLRDDGVDRIPRGPAPTTRDHPFGLTGRQAEVYELMADGLSNAEIASRLFVSKKTVEHHVSAVFTKLGVSTRAQAIAAHPG